MEVVLLRRPLQQDVWTVLNSRDRLASDTDTVSWQNELSHLSVLWYACMSLSSWDVWSIIHIFRTVLSTQSVKAAFYAVHSTVCNMRALQMCAPTMSLLTSLTSPIMSSEEVYPVSKGTKYPPPCKRKTVHIYIQDRHSQIYHETWWQLLTSSDISDYLRITCDKSTFQMDFISITF